MQVVITGGPSVGKTTLFNMLKASGFIGIDEIAAQVIKEGKVPAPWIDREAFQQEVFQRQLLSEEQTLNSQSICFLDRGAFDGAAYYICDGLPVPTAFDTIDGSRYSLVFLLEELPVFEEDGVRFENLEFTQRITPVLEQCYSNRGVQVIRVPCLPPDERLSFVLDKVGLGCWTSIFYSLRQKAETQVCSRPGQQL